MIIEETKYYYALEVVDISDDNSPAVAVTMEHPDFSQDCVINMDKQQVTQLIEVLTNWVNGEGVE